MKPIIWPAALPTPPSVIFGCERSKPSGLAKVNSLSVKIGTSCLDTAWQANCSERKGLMKC